MEKLEIQLLTINELKDNLKFQKLERSLEKKCPGMLELLLINKNNSSQTTTSNLINNTDNFCYNIERQFVRKRSTSNYSSISNISTYLNNSKSINQAYTKYNKEVIFFFLFYIYMSYSHFLKSNF